VDQDIRKAVSNLLSYQAKRDDAPCSAETHFGSALITLIEVSGYKTDNPEFQEIIDYYRIIGDYRSP